MPEIATAAGPHNLGDLVHPSLDWNCCLPCGTSRKDLTLSPIMEPWKMAVFKR